MFKLYLFSLLCKKLRFYKLSYKKKKSHENKSTLKSNKGLVLNARFLLCSLHDFQISKIKKKLFLKYF